VEEAEASVFGIDAVVEAFRGSWEVPYKGGDVLNVLEKYIHNNMVGYFSGGTCR
jgi:hypothetical protein